MSGVGPDSDGPVKLPSASGGKTDSNPGTKDQEKPPGNEAHQFSVTETDFSEGNLRLKIASRLKGLRSLQRTWKTMSVAQQ